MAKRASTSQRPSYRTGAKLVPMRSSTGSRDFILGQLSAVAGLLSKAMFGGLGLYADGVFFGLIARDALYLKVDDSNLARFESAGMAPFKPYADRPMTMRYWEVPVHVLEDADELLIWARASIAVAQVAPSKPKRGAGRSPAQAASGNRTAGRAGKAKTAPLAQRRAALRPGRTRGA